MKKRLFSLALCVAPFAAQPQDAPKRETHVEVIKANEPKALKFDVVIPAKPADVWQAFTTSAGLNAWLWQDCTVDLREGGGWIVHYPGGKTGGGTIVSFREGRQLVLHAMAPERFPEVRAVGTTAAFDFAPDGEGTRVTLTQTGWRQGKEWDDAYEYLAVGNAQLLEQLYMRFVSGPIKWH